MKDQTPPTQPTSEVDTQLAGWLDIGWLYFGEVLASVEPRQNGNTVFPKLSQASAVVAAGP